MAERSKCFREMKYTAHDLEVKGSNSLLDRTWDV